MEDDTVAEMRVMTVVMTTTIGRRKSEKKERGPRRRSVSAGKKKKRTNSATVATIAMTKTNMATRSMAADTKGISRNSTSMAEGAQMISSSSITNSMAGGVHASVSMTTNSSGRVMAISFPAHSIPSTQMSCSMSVVTATSNHRLVTGDNKTLIHRSSRHGLATVVALSKVHHLLIPVSVGTGMVIITTPNHLHVLDIVKSTAAAVVVTDGLHLPGSLVKSIEVNSRSMEITGMDQAETNADNMVEEDTVRVDMVVVEDGE